MKQPPNPHHRHRFPADLISHAAWLYHVFSPSLRDVELLLAERGIIVSCENIRRWRLKFGPDFADNLRRRRPQPGDKWPLDEVFASTNPDQVAPAKPWHNALCQRRQVSARLAGLELSSA